jgi:hypothetical protein
MRLIVLHDRSGEIIALGHIDPSKLNPMLKGITINVHPSEGQTLLEIHESGELHGKQAPEIVKEYKVDVHAKKLVKRKS